MERKNIIVDENWTPKDQKYLMCNLYAKTPKTVLTKVKGIEFERCNFYGCEFDNTNTLKQSNLIDTTLNPLEKTKEELRIEELESFIKDNNLIVPMEI